MSDDLNQKKSDYLLELALEESLQQDPLMLKYQSVDENVHEFSEEHKKRMKKIFKMAEKVEHRAAHRRRNYQIAAGIAVFLCVSTVAVTRVEAFRLPIIRFFMEMKEKSTLIGAQTENRVGLSDKYAGYEPSYVLDGYTVVQVKEYDNGFHIKYECEDGQTWYQYSYWENKENVDADSEDGSVQEETINGHPAMVVRKDDEIRISINNGAERFYLNGTIPYDEAVKIISSINF